jgi:hypothetical protein
MEEAVVGITLKQSLDFCNRTVVLARIVEGAAQMVARGIELLGYLSFSQALIRAPHRR